MKKLEKYLKYAGLCSAVLALVAFVLLMATEGCSYDALGQHVGFPGTTVIFGGTSTVGATTYVLAWSALVAWILLLAALLILVAGVVLPALKIKKLQKFAGLLNLIAVGSLVASGVFVFLSGVIFEATNSDVIPTNVGLGAGWVISGILLLVSGIVAALPAVADFASKK